jgi:tape measure domain-containing protein
MTAVASAEVIITPEFRQFASELQRGINSAMGNAERIVARASVSISDTMAGAGTEAATGLESAFGRAVSGIGSAVLDLARTVGSTLLDMARSVARAVGDTIRTAANIGIGALGALTGFVVSSGIAFNDLSQQVTGALTAVLGTRDAANDLIAEVIELNRTAAFSREAFLDATRQLVGFGVQADMVVDVLDAIQQATVAIGGGEDEFRRITEALARVESEGQLTHGTLGILRRMGLDVIRIIAEATGTSIESVQALMDEGQIGLEEITDALNTRFAGAVDDYANTWQGAQGIIIANLRNIGSELVEAFIGIEEGGALIEGVNRLSESIVTFGEGPIQNLIPLTEALADKFVEFSDAVASLIETLPEDLFQNVLGIFEEFGPIIAAVGAGLITMFAGSLPFIGQFFAGLNPIVIAIGALIAATPELREAFVDMLVTIFEAFQPIIPVFATLAEGVLGALIPAIQALLEGFGRLAESLVPVITQASILLVDIFESIGVPLVELFVEVLLALAQVLNDLFLAFSPVIQAIIDFTSEIIQGLTPLLPPLTQILHDFAITIGNTLGRAIEIVLPLLATLVTALAENLLPHLPDIVAAFLILIDTALEPLLDFIELILPQLIDLAVAFLPLIGLSIELWAAILPLLDPLVELGNFALPLLNESLEAIIPAIEMAIEWLTNFIESVVETVSGVLNNWEEFEEGTVETFTAVTETITEIWNAAKDTLEELWTGLVAVSEMHWENIKEALTQSSLEAQKNVIDNIFQLFEDFGRLLLNIWEVAVNWFNLIRDGIIIRWEMTVARVREDGERLLNWFRELPGRIRDNLAMAGRILVGRGRALIEGFFTGVRVRWGMMRTWILGFPERIRNAIPNPRIILIRVGREIMDGLWTGLRVVWGNIQRWFREITDQIPVWKGPESEDRMLLRRSGQLIMGGFEEGLRDEFTSVMHTLQEMTEAVRDKVPAGLGLGMSGILPGSEIFDLPTVFGRPPSISRNIDEASTSSFDDARSVDNFIGTAVIDLGEGIERVFTMKFQRENRNLKQRVRAGSGTAR